MAVKGRSGGLPGSSPAGAVRIQTRSKKRSGALGPKARGEGPETKEMAPMDPACSGLQAALSKWRRTIRKDFYE